MDTGLKKFVACGELKRQHFMGVTAATKEEAVAMIREELDDPSYQQAFLQWQAGGEVVIEDSMPPAPAATSITIYAESFTMELEPAPGSTHFQVTFGSDIPGTPDYITDLLPIDQLDPVREMLDKHPHSVWATVFFYTRIQGPLPALLDHMNHTRPSVTS